MAGTLGHLGTLTRYINYQSMSNRAQSVSASISCPLIILHIAVRRYEITNLRFLDYLVQNLRLRRDSDSRPEHYKGPALPTELHRHGVNFLFASQETNKTYSNLDHPILLFRHLGLSFIMYLYLVGNLTLQCPFSPSKFVCSSKHYTACGNPYQGYRSTLVKPMTLQISQFLLRSVLKLPDTFKSQFSYA